MNRLIIVVGIFILIVIAAAVLILVPGPNTANAPTEMVGSLPDLITVTSPLPQKKITSPLLITGKARGNWYFEASAPFQLKDAAGKVIAQGHVDAQGDWMTTDFVPFMASTTFPAQPEGSIGALILMNDNPSGDPAKQKELNIPVVF